MRTRTAKKLAQRIDLNYFKRSHGMRRSRMVLSIAAPALGLLWLGGMAVAGSRAPYSSGPVSSAHAFVEMKCEVCHQPPEGAGLTSFRAHVTDKACLTCHDGPAHAANQPAPPDCASCHREHEGRVSLAASTPDARCISCHGDLETTGTAPAIARNIGKFPDDHPPFAALASGVTDPGTLAFNHQVHAKQDLRGPTGPETLECSACHKPELARAGARQTAVSGLMAPVNYEQQCARCHPLFFDERIDAPAPHEEPAAVRAFVQESLRAHIAANPRALTERGVPRRLPLNFPRAEPPAARTPAEWVARRAARAEEFLWGKVCADCHVVETPAAADRLPAIAPVRLTQQWMPKARFDHAPHLMVQCASCHNAENSRETSDVLMPSVSTCATCHAPSKGASSQCIECHGYHDWSKAQPVKPHFKLTDFQ